MSSLACLAALDVTNVTDGPEPGMRLSLAGLELPAQVTPTVAGIVVGVVAGILGFLVVALLATRKRARAEVVTIPPYTMGPDAMAPARRVGPEPTMRMPIPMPLRKKGVPVALTASRLAEMGIPVGPFGERNSPPPPPPPSASVDVAFELDGDAEPLDLVETEDGHLVEAVAVSPVVVIAGPPRDASKSAPHPLGIIKSGSSAMVGTPSSGVTAMPASGPRPTAAAYEAPREAKPIFDLEFDDAPTQIAEPFFDETPQPRTRGSRPKIRPVQPSGPRFTSGQDAVGKALLPPVPRPSPRPQRHA